MTLGCLAHPGAHVQLDNGLLISSYDDSVFYIFLSRALSVWARLNEVHGLRLTDIYIQDSYATLCLRPTNPTYTGRPPSAWQRLKAYVTELDRS